jgi:small subunit ribosomal protein S6
MAATIYECLFLLDTAKVSGDVAGAGKQIQAILEKNQAEVLASRPWDERRLAYSIKKHKKGLYYLTYFRTEGKNLVNIRRDIALSELILRSLMLAIHPKLVDTMLSVARDEHALALQLMHEDQPDEPAGEGEDRRGRRAPEAAAVAAKE